MEAPKSDAEWMRVALAHADSAGAHGDVPVGCVVIDSGGRVVGVGRNQREILQDPTAHAEILAIQAASKSLGSWRLVGCTVYVTLEPCPMCAGALVHARVARLVYGCDDPKTGAVASLYNLGSDSRLNHRFIVERGLLADECSSRLKEFFASLRQLGKK